MLTNHMDSQSLNKSDINSASRKRGHLDLAEKSQTPASLVDSRFYYEPLLSAHPDSHSSLESPFLGKTMQAPLWISSMTGGTKSASTINQNLAEVAGEYGLGFGLGSCRSLLESKEYFADFNMRPFVGDAPFYANLGIAQVEQLLAIGEVHKIHELVKSLEADGLIIHINPLQEWFQPEGDLFKKPPLETLKRFCGDKKYKIIIKEVGQGMGPASLEALCQLPVDAIEFGSFGGTNFSKIEIMRGKTADQNLHKSMSCVGHTAGEMVENANSILRKQDQMPAMIISGGIFDFLDGYYLMKKYQGISVYGQAKAFLTHAMIGKEALREYVEAQISGLKMAQAFLRIKEESN